VHPSSVLIEPVSPVHKHRVNFFGRGQGSVAHHVERLRDVLHYFFRRLLGTIPSRIALRGVTGAKASLRDMSLKTLVLPEINC